MSFFVAFDSETIEVKGRVSDRDELEALIASLSIYVSMVPPAPIDPEVEE